MGNCVTSNHSRNSCWPKQHLTFCCCRRRAVNRVQFSQDLNKAMENNLYRLQPRPEVFPQQSPTLAPKDGPIQGFGHSPSSARPVTVHKHYENVTVEKPYQRGAMLSRPNDESEGEYMSYEEDHIYGNDMSCTYYNYNGPLFSSPNEAAPEDGEDVYIFPDNEQEQ
ncbi:protein GAPT [Amia ocellicauda]|uniref:protein GAPT n=1 Tax=Amia ocellicauda TaxID=2972642 RepID=UPI003464E272